MPPLNLDARCSVADRCLVAVANVIPYLSMHFWNYTP